MTAEETLYASIQASAPLIVAVGTSVYPDYVPQDCDLPGIAYIRIDTENYDTIHAPATASKTTLEVYVMAKSRTQSISIADLFESAMRTAKIYMSGRRSEFDADNGIWSTIFTVQVFLNS